MLTGEAPPSDRRSAAMLDESPLMTLVSAGLFLWVGFFLGLEPFSDAPPLYKISVWGFTWMGRIVGLALLVVAAKSFMRIGLVSVWLEAIASIAACAGCLFCGAVWLIYSDTQGVLLLLFGLLNGSAARASIVRLRDASWRAP